VGYHSEVAIGSIWLKFFYTGYQIDRIELLEPAENMNLQYGDSLGNLNILIMSWEAKTIPNGTDYFLSVVLSGEGTILLDTADAADALANMLNYEELDCSELGLVYSPESEEEENSFLPQNFILFQNYPNPFNPYTNILYKLKGEFFVKLEIYDILGNRLKNLISEKQTPGLKSAIWDGKDEQGNPLPSGIYLYRLEAGAEKKTKKMILLK